MFRESKSRARSTSIRSQLPFSRLEALIVLLWILVKALQTLYSVLYTTFDVFEKRFDILDIVGGSGDLDQVEVARATLA